MKRLSYLEFKELCRTKKVVDTTTGLRADTSKMIIGGEDIFKDLPIQVGTDNSTDGYEIYEESFSDITQVSENKIIAFFSSKHSFAGTDVTFSVDSW